MQLRPKVFLLTFLALLLLFGFIKTTRANPGISVVLVGSDPITTDGSAKYQVNVTSITTEDEHVELKVTGDLSLAFNWTSKSFVLIAGASESFGLEANHSGSDLGTFEFNVSAEAWPTRYSYAQAQQLGVIETSSFTDHVQVIPEFPSIIATLLVITATTLVAVVHKKRLR